jgi:hypothetical protein
MNQLDERKLEFQRRVKHNKVESILRTMRGAGITVDDLQGHTIVTAEQKLKEQRAKTALKNKQRDSLIKAREAKANKNTPKGV